MAAMTTELEKLVISIVADWSNVQQTLNHVTAAVSDFGGDLQAAIQRYGEKTITTDKVIKEALVESARQVAQARKDAGEAFYAYVGRGEQETARATQLLQAEAQAALNTVKQQRVAKQQEEKDRQKENDQVLAALRERTQAKRDAEKDAVAFVDKMKTLEGQRILRGVEERRLAEEKQEREKTKLLAQQEAERVKIARQAQIERDAAQREGMSAFREVSEQILHYSFEIGKRSVEAFAEYEFAITRIIATTHAAREQVQQWGKDILELAPQVGIMPTNLAHALRSAIAGGVKAEGAMDALGYAAKATASGLGDIEILARIGKSTFNAYAASGVSFAHALDTVAAGVKESKVETAEFSRSLGRVIPIAAALGVPLEDVIGTLSVMTRTGASASEAVVSLAGMYSAFIKPSKQAKDTIEATGVSFAKVRDILKGKGGTVEVLRLLQDTFGGDTEAMGTLVRDIRPLRGMLSVLSQRGGVVDNILESVWNNTGEVDKSFRDASKTLQFKFNQAMAQLQVTLIQLGEELKGKLLPVIELITSSLKIAGDVMKSLGPIITNVIVPAILSLAAPSIISGVGMLITAFKTWAVTITGPVVAAMAVLLFNFERFAALVTGTDLTKQFDRFTEAIKTSDRVIAENAIKFGKEIQKGMDIKDPEERKGFFESRLEREKELLKNRKALLEAMRKEYQPGGFKGFIFGLTDWAFPSETERKRSGLKIIEDALKETEGNVSRLKQEIDAAAEASANLRNNFLEVASISFNEARSFFHDLQEEAATYGMPKDKIKLHNLRKKYEAGVEEFWMNLAFHEAQGFPIDIDYVDKQARKLAEVKRELDIAPQLIQHNEMAKANEKFNQTMKETINHLEIEAKMVKATADEKKIEDLRRKGATQDQIAQAERLINIRKAGELELQAMLPEARFDKKYRDYADLLSGRFINRKTFQDAVHKAREEMKNASEEWKLKRKFFTPIEKYEEDISNLDDALKNNRITWETYQKAVLNARKELQGAGEAMQNLQGTSVRSAEGFAKVYTYLIGLVQNLGPITDPRGKLPGPILPGGGLPSEWLNPYVNPPRPPVPGPFNVGGGLPPTASNAVINLLNLIASNTGKPPIELDDSNFGKGGGGLLA